MATLGCWNCNNRVPGEPCAPVAVDTANNFAVIDMSPDDRKRVYRKELLLMSAIVAAGLVMSGLSLTELSASNSQVAQATQPLQASPPTTPDNAPAESKPGGMRPTTPAPEPAHPAAGSQTTGAAPALPPAPAEKIAPPIKER
jgi:hypothetical protein